MKLDEKRRPCRSSSFVKCIIMTIVINNSLCTTDLKCYLKQMRRFGFDVWVLGLFFLR